MQERHPETPVTLYANGSGGLLVGVACLVSVIEPSGQDHQAQNKCLMHHVTRGGLVYIHSDWWRQERMGGTGADVIGLDWTVDMADARKRLEPQQAVQVSCVWFSVSVCGPELALMTCKCNDRAWRSILRYIASTSCTLLVPGSSTSSFDECDAIFAILQGNVDPVILFAEHDAIEAAVRDVLRKAGPMGHILNLGHGVVVGTPEDAVAHMFQLSKEISV